MAQPAPAPEIQPTVTVRVQNGVPSPDPVQINVGQLVEFHNEDNSPYQIPLSYLNNGANDNYPLAAYLPAGGKCGLIGMSAASCEYNIFSVSAGGRVDAGPPYNIIVNSNEPEAGSR